MELNPTNTTTTTPTSDAENETPPHPLSIKSKSFINNSFAHHHLHLHHHPPPPPPPPGFILTFKECLKNHAATMGGHALDGCGEFMPSPNCSPTEPASLTCAACGCHRNFHRRDHEGPAPVSAHFLEFRRGSPSPSSSPPPPPLSYPSVPQMLLALRPTGPEDHPLTVSHIHNHPQHPHHHHMVATPATPTAFKVENSGRKRFRTKFSQDQKDKMLVFAEKLGWKMQRCDENLIEKFCSEIGISRGVLKVWLHNNKSTLGKREGKLINFSNINHNLQNHNVGFKDHPNRNEIAAAVDQHRNLILNVSNNNNNASSSDS